MDGFSFRLNEDDPEDHLIAKHLRQVPRGKMSATLKQLIRMAIQAKETGDKGAPEILPPAPPPVPRAQQRDAFQPPDKPDRDSAARALRLLEPGEIDCLASVAWHPFLAHVDVAAWLGRPTPSVRPDMARLRHFGLITSISRVVDHFPSMDYHILTPFGLWVMAVREGRRIPEAKSDLGFGNEQRGYPDHCVGANRFFLYLHSRKDEGRLLEWRSEAACRQPLAGRNQSLRPDGLGMWAPHDSSDTFDFFLEWHRSEGNYAKLRAKLMLYRIFYREQHAGAMTSADTVIVPRLLFVMRDEYRLEQLWKLAQEVGAAGGLDPIPMLATHRGRLCCPHYDSLRPIWEASPGGRPVDPWIDL